MKQDFYTKAVLTVIAVALVAIVFQNTKTANEAKAEKVNFNKFATVPINDDGSINVKMTSDMDVNIRSIGGSSIYGTIPINIKEISGTSFYGSVPFNLKEIGGSTINTSYGIPVNIQAMNSASITDALPVRMK